MSDRSWLDELDLDASSSWRAMGTRALGERPWLTGEQSNLGLRAELLRDRFDEVCAAPASAFAGIDELLNVVCAASGLERPAVASGSEQLAWLGRSVAEDLCLLRRGSAEWEFEAGVLCFPSRWRLVDKLGRPLREVHGPVDGYDPVLADRVTSLLDRLGEQIVVRRNWFVHPNAELFQPHRPVDGDPLVPREQVLERLYVRSERQTLRALPHSKRVVFTIATQQCSLGEFVADDERRSSFVDYLDQAPADQVTHRGLAPAQAAAVLQTIS